MNFSQKDGKTESINLYLPNFDFLYLRYIRFHIRNMFTWFISINSTFSQWFWLALYLQSVCSWFFRHFGSIFCWVNFTKIKILATSYSIFDDGLFNFTFQEGEGRSNIFFIILLYFRLHVLSVICHIYHSEFAFFSVHLRPQNFSD